MNNHINNGNITLEGTRRNDQYDFTHLYNSITEDVSDDLMRNNIFSCNYYSPEELPNIHSSDQCMQNNLSICSLNCQSLSAHWDQIKILFSEMSSPKFSFDIIGFCEIFDIKENTSFELEGYHKFEYNDRPKDDDGRGGVGLFVKECFSYRERNDLSEFISHVFESIFIELQFENKKNIIVGNVYRPNTWPRADLDRFIVTLSNIIEIINQENKLIVLLGDYNIDLLKYGTHIKTTEFLDDMISHGLLPVITKPTRITKHSATLIDHIYTNIIQNTSSSGIILTDIADHFGTFLIIKKEKPKKEPNGKYYRSFNQTNIDQFKTILNQCDFSGISNYDNADEAYSYFMELYQNAFNLAFPLKYSKYKSKYIKRESWLTEGLLVSSNHKKKLYKIKLDKPTEENINTYKNYRDMFNKQCRTAKKMYYNNLFNLYKNDMKRSWNILNQVIQNAKTNKCTQTCFLINNLVTSNKKAIAEGFNNFFASVGKNYADNIQMTDTQFDRHLTDHYPQSFFLSPVIPDDIIKHARLLKPKLSQGHDNISNKLTKATIDEIAVPLAHIFNLSFSTGEVPKSMKLAKIVPIFKSGNNQILNNYRPISLLPSFSKLLEKIVHKQLISFLNNNNILYGNQYGFREKHSTIHPVVQLIKYITEQNDKRTKDVTLSVFLDLSKAFDTISHDILLKKLDYYGIRGLANSWFTSYLSNRKQFTEFQGNISSTADINYGVPQGSILGPLLFLIYINDLPSSTNLNILSFADDTTAYMSGHDLPELNNTVNTELNKLYTWLCENKLSLNINKTHFMIFSPNTSNTFSDINIIINNQQVQQNGLHNECKFTKFLGVYFDQNLSWKFHINKICCKMKNALYVMNKAKNILPTSSMRSIYFALIHSHLMYGILAWGNSKSVNKLFKLQKRAVRIISNTSYRSHTDPLFKMQGILKLEHIYELEVSKFAYDHINNNLPYSFRSFYPNPRISDTITRLSSFTNLYPPRPRTEFSRMSIYHNLPCIWNKINNEIKHDLCRPSFIRKIKKAYIDQYLPIVSCNDPYCSQCNP